MNYAQAQKAVFATGTVPDGYFGDRTHAGFAFDPESGKTLVVHDSGFHQSLLPPAIDLRESKWLLANHPLAKKYYTVKKGYRETPQQPALDGM